MSAMTLKADCVLLHLTLHGSMWHFHHPWSKCKRAASVYSICECCCCCRKYLWLIGGTIRWWQLWNHCNVRARLGQVHVSGSTPTSFPTSVTIHWMQLKHTITLFVVGYIPPHPTPPPIKAIKKRIITCDRWGTEIKGPMNSFKKKKNNFKSVKINRGEILHGCSSIFIYIICCITALL